MVTREGTAIALLAGALVVGCALDLPERADGYESPVTSGNAEPITPTAFVGNYESNWGPVQISLAEGGAGLVGYYGNGPDGRLAGNLSGDRFYFLWVGDKSGQHGHGYFERTKDGIAGRWGYGEDWSREGLWSGSRK